MPHVRPAGTPYLLHYKITIMGPVYDGFRIPALSRNILWSKGREYNGIIHAKRKKIYKKIFFRPLVIPFYKILLHCSTVKPVKTKPVYKDILPKMEKIHGHYKEIQYKEI